MNDTKTSSDAPAFSHQRRRLLKRLGLALGAGVTSQILSGPLVLQTALAYEPKTTTLDTNGLVLSRGQLLVLNAICAQVIPATDTPGAVEVDVPGFIDHLLFHCETPDQQSEVAGVLDRMQDQSMTQHGIAFEQLDNEQQLFLLTAIERVEGGFSDADRQAFKNLKNQIVFGYFSSEPGATLALKYDAVPGGFTGSIPYAATDKAWYR